ADPGEIRRGERGHEPRVVRRARELGLRERDRPFAIGPRIKEPLERGRHVDDIGARRREDDADRRDARGERGEPECGAPHGSGTSAFAISTWPPSAQRTVWIESPWSASGG